MKESEIKELAANGIFQHKPLHGKVEETHISWVILTRKYAFKLKKPVKLSFLDFSSLKRRKHFCLKEVALNRRFTHIYLDVLPIRRHNERLSFGRGRGKVIDYAVRMKRMMSAKRMDHVLRWNEVHKENVTSLASVIASFHVKAEVINSPFNLAQARNLFNDISGIRNFVTEHLGNSYTEIITQSMLWSTQFLKLHARRIQERIDLGYKRDVHGDLHSGNIFLYRNPVLFDCIEFNDQYRQIDVLYEIAFICMDLDSFHLKHLAKIFLSEYSSNFHCFETTEDEKIFHYFKCLRANVRAKIHATSAVQIGDQQKMKHHVRETKKYLSLIKAYMSEL